MKPSRLQWPCSRWVLPRLVRRAPILPSFNSKMVIAGSGGIPAPILGAIAGRNWRLHPIGKALGLHFKRQSPTANACNRPARANAPPMAVLSKASIRIV
jgi:hypothetical protein